MTVITCQNHHRPTNLITLSWRPVSHIYWHTTFLFSFFLFCFNLTAIRLKTQWNKQSIYLCDASFSVMTLIKTKHWGRLHLKQFHYCSELPATKNDEAPQWSAFSLKCKFLGTLLMRLQCYLSSAAWRKRIGLAWMQWRIWFFWCVCLSISMKYR